MNALLSERPYRELMLGAGSRHTRILQLPEQGYSGPFKALTTVDANADHRPDVVHDLNVTPWPLPSDAFDECHAYEVLEHLGQLGDAASFFAHFTEIWRILKPGGLLFATVPSLKSPWLFGDPSHRRVICSQSLAFLSQAEYVKQVGKTPMSDFRSIYTADFQVMAQDDSGPLFAFVLRALK